MKTFILLGVLLYSHMLISIGELKALHKIKKIRKEIDSDLEFRCER